MSSPRFSPLPLLLLAPLLLPACASSLPLTRPPVPPAALALARRAEVLLQEERVGEALEAAHAAAALAPRAPETLRMVQATRLAAGADAGVRADTEAFLAAEPGNPVALYLLARTEGDGSRSEALVRAALDIDPGLVWARLGLAQVLLGKKDLTGALSELARADELDPDQPWVPLLQAQAAMAAKKPEAALERLRECVRRDPGWYRGHEALARTLLRVPGKEAEARASFAAALALAPGSRPLATAFREALEEGASPEELAAATALLHRLEAAAPLTPEARHLRGRARFLLGDAAAALPDLEAAAGSGEDRTASLDDLRLALFTLGRYSAALAAEEAATPADLLHDPASETDVRRWFLERAAAGAEARPDDPDALGRLSDLCRRTGWHREAHLVAKARLALAPSAADPAAAAAVEETARTLRFLGELRRSWKGTYHGYAGGEDGEGLDGALAALRRLSLDTLGLDVTEGMARRSYALLGEMAETVRAEGPCREWFDAHGLALLVGRASGEPVEARLLRVVALRRDAPWSSLGRRFRATVVTGEGLLVPSRRESGGAVLGGATVGDLVFLDLEGVARWSGAASRNRRDPAVRSVLEAVPREVPAGLEESLPFRFPGRLSDRTALAVPRWDYPVEALGDFLDAALVHELAHAADAARYLPVTSHPLEGLRLLLRGGLSAEGAASILEGDAEIAALAGAREPRASLATLTSFLPVRDAGAPHGRGYFEALEDLVEVLRERGLLPAGPGAVRLLDRIEGEALRSAAREVCRRRGLLGNDRE